MGSGQGIAAITGDMVKKRSEEGKQSKMTVMVFQLEGDDATLQDGLRTIGAALAKVLPHNVPAPATRVITLTADQAEVSMNGSENVDEVPGEQEEERSTARLERQRRAVKSPSILELDLTSGDVPLAKFLNNHPLESINKKYLFVAYWLKNQRQILEVTSDHIHTCYRHMGWQTPKDAAQPLRDGKSKLDWFSNGEARGSYRINHVGENQVLKIIEGNA